jgi:aspartate/methionine/tyrosine aminotransferase
MLMNAPAGLREKLELVADTFLSVAAPVQHALPRLLESGALVREQIRRRTRENLRWLRTVAQPLLVEGGWYAVLPVAGEEEEELVLRLLRDRNVLTQPGFFYDFPAGQYLVLSLLARPEEFRRGVQWIIQEAPAASRPSSHASP